MFQGKLAKDLSAAESDALARPDSRTKLQHLLGLYALAGKIDRAAELSSRWASRDPLDPGALLARAEVAARKGQRAKAIRILGGLADVRPDDSDVQNWLAGIFDSLHEQSRACAHRLALADLRPKDAEAVARAVRCARDDGRSALATSLLADLAPGVAPAVERELAKPPTVPSLGGDLRIDATWDADVDLDVAVIGKGGSGIRGLGIPKAG